MNMQTSTIPVHVLERAKQIGIEQGYLPVSPYSIERGSKIALCAAACLAYAGCEARSNSAAQNFLRDLTAHGSGAVVAATYKWLNWPESLCRLVMVENDRTPSELRLSTFLMRCEALKAATS